MTRRGCAVSEVRDEVRLRLTHAVHHHDVAFPDVSCAHQEPAPVPRRSQPTEAGDSRCAKRERSQASHDSIAESVEVDRVGILSHCQEDDAIPGDRPETESDSIQNDRFLPACDRHLHKPAGSADPKDAGGRAVQIVKGSTIWRLLRLYTTVARNTDRLIAVCGNSPEFRPAGAVRGEIDPAPVGRPFRKAVGSRLGRHWDR